MEITVPLSYTRYEHTDKNAPTLLLLHGLGSSQLDWEYQIEPIRTRFNLVIPDLRGHGESPKPDGPYSIQTMAADIVALIQKQSDSFPTRSIHVVGLSLGAMVALQLAVDHPDLVASVVVVNSPPSMKPMNFKETLMVWQRRLLMGVVSMRKIGEILSTRLFPNVNHKAIRERFIERWARNDKKAYKATFNAIIGWDVTDRLSELKNPVHILVSDRDYTPIERKSVILDHAPMASMQVLRDCHHAVSVENPALFNQALLSFYDSLLKTKGINPNRYTDQVSTE